MKTPRWIWGSLVAALSLGCGDDGSGGNGAEAGGGSGGSGGAGATGGSGAGGGDGGANVDPRFQPLVDALEADLAASDAFGVSVAVLEKGEVTFAHAIGSKDAEGAEPLTPHTLMQIGSTTKQLTAAALLRKVDAGALSLDSTVEEVLPGVEFTLDPTWDDQMTMHHLLSHQSGLYDFADWSDAPDDDHLEDLMGDLDDELFLMSPPGAFWNYSNAGFSLAGLATEHLDTRAWSDILHEDLFAPLGMSRTFMRKSEAVADGDYSLSFGFTKSDLQTGGPQGAVEMDDVLDSAFSRPAGLAWSTPTEMLAWARFLMEGNEDVLSDELRGELTSAQVDTLFLHGSMQYGYGMFVWDGYLTADGDVYETPVWEHGGNTLTFTNIMIMLPEHDFAVVITSSAYGTDFARSADAAIESLVEGLPSPVAFEPYEVDPSTFDRHVGSYDDPYNVGAVEISLEGDELRIAMPDLDALGYDVDPVLTPISSDIFVVTIDGEPMDVTFIPEGAGDASTFMRNRSFVVTRMADAPPSPSPLPSQVRRARVDQALARSRVLLD